MTTEIKPEDIEAAIAAAEQRRRLRMGETQAGPVAPRRPGTEPGAPAADRGRDDGSATSFDDLDDSWLEQPAAPARGRYAELPDSEVVWDQEERRRGMILPLGIAAVALVAFGGIIWWAYSSTPPDAGDGIPLVAAENGPVKVKPESEGGIEVPDQDKMVFEQLAEAPEEPKVEQLLPEPEQPITPPQPAGTTASAVPLVPETETAAPATTAASPSPSPTAGQPATSVAAPAAAPQPAAGPASETAPPAPAATPAPNPPAAAAAAKPIQTASAGGWRIQLAAVKTEAGARAEWSRLQKVHPDLLGDMRLNLERVNLGEKGIYVRIQAGPLPDRTTAEDMCGELKATKQPCLVVKP
jgi:cell division septation protein DedD